VTGTTPGDGWPPPAPATTCWFAAASPTPPTWRSSPATCGEGRPATLPVLVTIAGRRWPVEEDLQVGKSHFGLADSQVRTYTALHRHITLAMAAAAVCATAAAAARSRTPALPPLPTNPEDLPPADPGLVPFTVAEIKRLLNLLLQPRHSLRHYLHWSWWRRRHQARARWHHHRTRLQRQTTAA
jgi:hypothetical protein